MTYTGIKDKLGILFIVVSFYPLPMGGAEIQSKRLSDQFVQKGIPIFILTTGKRNLPKEEMLEGIQVHRVNSYLDSLKDVLSFLCNRVHTRKRKKHLMKRGNDILIKYETLIGFREIAWGLLFFWGSFCFLLKHGKKFKIIQVNTVEMAAVIGALLGKIFRKKVIIRDSTMNGLVKLGYAPLGKYLQRIVVKNCHFVAMTQQIEENYRKVGVAADKISRIPNGIEIQEIIRRKKFDFKCLFVGNLYQQPAKGVDILLRAWKRIVAAFPHATLTIVGDGNTSEYYNFTKELSISRSVHFMGKQNPGQFYLDADVFILPSRREGMSNALIEAMIYKLAIVATDISGSRDLLKNNVNGLLIPPENIGKLSDAIIYLFNNPALCLTLGNNARKTVEEHCDIKKVAEKYIELYDFDDAATV
ncbi:MAG TPA: glycosyltransferase family 4 protein [Candidatus Wunengus sp. YC63]|uniref:glycosyltransferase family 4 protein n=1 Tax=unclassified Candidatus Wunengus TaxID=3367695 RepID=UPI004026B5E6